MVKVAVRAILALAVALVSLAGLSFPVEAQDYSFVLNRNISRVYINQDASIDLEYELTFTCDPGADPIDIIDVGMPHGNYDLSSVTADLDGMPLSDIRESEVLRDGVEVHLGRSAIRPGRQGTLRLRAHVYDMVFPDSEDEEYASIRFSPTWYDGDAVHGDTILQTSFYFPPGVQPDEPRYHDEPFTDALVEGDSVVYTWTIQAARPDRQYTFGASFPRRYVDRVAEPPAFGSIDFEALLGCGAFLLFGIGFIVSVIWSIRVARKRRMEYLPPSLAVEGVEIRRGLTAPEAAVLLELPLNKVLSLIAFGLIRKNALRVVSQEPLRLERVQPAPPDLRPYEVSFLSAIGPDGRVSDRRLREVTVELIQLVAKKMKGFSLDETRAYYRSIVDKAWEKVRDSADADLSDELLAETIEWTTLDRDFERKAPEVWVGRSFRRPIWWGNYAPYYGRPSTSSERGGGGGGTISVPDVRMPTLPGSEFAHGIVSGLEGMANSVVGNIESFTSSVTRQTNPPPPPSRSGGRSSGGGGCACACACAGCACACAGGGR